MARIKGIVLENKGGRAVILSPAGEYKRIRINKPIEVGELYDGYDPAPWRYVIAAGVILAITLGTLDFFSVRAYAQVSPSLELGINRWHRVVATRALDNKGEEMLKQSNFTGQKVDEAVEVIIDKAIDEGSLEQDTPPKVFPVQASDKGNKDEEFIERVEQNMNKGLQKAIDKRNNKANSDKAVKKDQDKGSDMGSDRSLDRGPEKNENENSKDN